MSEQPPLAPKRIVELNTDDQLDEFKVNKFLGKGKSNYAKVYCVNDKYALKLFVLERQDPGYALRLQKFKDEAQILMKLKTNEHIVESVCYYRDKGVLNAEDVEAHYYVMERMDMSLEDYLTRNLDWALKSKLEVLQQVLTGLKDCHDAEIYHRDLYAPNVLLHTKQNDIIAKLCDFGSAKIFTQEQQSPYFIPMGNKHYTSPEACVGLLGGNSSRKELFISADLYSFGMLLYETISGVPLEQISAQLVYSTNEASRNGLFDPSCNEDKRNHFLDTRVVPLLKLVQIKDIIISNLDNNDEIEKRINELVHKLLEPAYGQRLDDLDEVMTELLAIKELIL